VYSPLNSTAPPGVCRAQTKLGDPIYPLNGSAAESVNLELGIKEIDAAVNYDTSLAAPLNGAYLNANAGADFAALSGHSLGGFWSLLTDKHLVSLADLKTIVIYDGAGRVVLLQKNSSNQFVSKTGGQLVAYASSGGYYYYDFARNVVESYDASGNLQAISRASGGQVTLVYSDSSTPLATAPGAGFAIQAADSFGRAIAFAYQTRSSGKSRLMVASAPTESVNFSYDANDNLSAISWVQSASSQNFHYNATNIWALEAILDESNVSWHSFAYDAQGHANSTWLGNGVDTYTVSYSDAMGAAVVPSATALDTEPTQGSTDIATRQFQWNNPASMAIAKPNGTTAVVIPTIAADFPAQGSLSQPAGAGCAASTSSSSYDAFGNSTSRDDFNGNRTCYAYDTARGLQTMALEGRSSANACSFIPSTADIQHPERLITTSWHPDWALKAREAEPKKITTWVYNGQADPISGTTASCVTPATTLPDGKPLAALCKRYEQATTDTTGVLGFAATVSGAARVWTYTYNQYGQMLTETTPKLSPTDSLSHTTTYAYYTSTSFSGMSGYTVGDLQSVTNPLGQVTTFGAYDPAGRLLSSADPNGAVTSQTYYPRGWLQTQTVTSASGAALTTSYVYWPTGLLKTVTMPDASTLNYAYDNAHRLTDITDGAGNKLHYVLDNAGNRTGEQVSDASGNLASSVTRVFDALNRVQSATGAMH